MFIRSVSCLAAAISLSACANTVADLRDGSRENAGLCPNIFALEDAARVVEFAGEPSLETVAWSAEITNVSTSCRYLEDRPIRANVQINMSVGRGPAAGSDTHELEYFVAVTRRNRDVIAKETFTRPVRIRGDIASVDITEDVRSILIPRRDESISGTNFEIAVGFSVTREQVLYNRSGQSLKFPEL